MNLMGSSISLGTGTVDGDRPVRERRIALIVGLVIKKSYNTDGHSRQDSFIIVFAGGAQQMPWPPTAKICFFHLSN